jgi:hypothetical protein
VAFIQNGKDMKLTALLTIAAAIVAGCAHTNYQQFEGRNGPQIIEGTGGTKEIVNGYEIWDNGTPPRRYEVLGVVAVEDFDNVFGNQRIRSALSDQLKAAGGDAAVVVDTSGGGSGMSMAFGSNGQMAAGPTFGKKTARWQIIKYLDKK